MTKAGYTHVLIPISLHSVLKERANSKKTSISKYLESLLYSAQASRSDCCETTLESLWGFAPREFNSPPRRHDSKEFKRFRIIHTVYSLNVQMR